MQNEIPTSFGEGRFIVAKELGRGSMGVVYEAFDKERDMRVALKTLRNMNSENLYCFKREFRNLHDIVHPNLCSLMELIQDDVDWFLTMELIHGVDFLSYVRGSDECSKLISSQDPEKNISDPGEKSPLYDERRLRRALAGLCEGVHVLHSMDKIHRDIKPSNVLICEQNRVVLLDFGLIADNKTSLQTNRMTILGTAAYMAPEQADAEAVGPEADSYSIGVMLYEALTGQLPFTGNLHEILLAKQIQDPVRPSVVNPFSPGDLEQLCLDLLNRNPAERPTAEDILQLTRTGSLYPAPRNAPLPGKMTKGDLFVGREKELDSLGKAYREMSSTGSLKSVLIEGVSGVGKSALVERFTAGLLSTNPEAVILEGRCYERESAPFKAFDGIIDSLISHLKQFPHEKDLRKKLRHSDLLVRLFPSFGRSDFFSSIPLTQTRIEDVNEMQRRSFDALKELLYLQSSKNPLVVIIDDVQWADKDSILLLQQIVSKVRTPKNLLILLSRLAKSRLDADFDWDTILPGDHTHIQLEALGTRDAEQLVQMMIDEQDVQMDLDAESIAQEAGGHPLFIAEMVQHVALSGETVKSGHLDEVIWFRMKAFPEEAKRVLRTVCIAGVPMESQHLQNLTELESDTFFSSIAALRSARLIRSSGPRKEHLVEPYHDRVREAVMAHEVSADEIAEMCLWMGRYFLEVYSDLELEQHLFSVVQLLHNGKDQITEKEELSRLAELLYLAGKKARDAGAFVLSLSYFNKSMDLHDEEDWKTSYDSMFALHRAAAEAAHVTGHISLTQRLVAEGRKRAKSNLDKASIYEIYLQSLVADGKPFEAIDETIAMIGRLGVKMAYRPRKIHVLLRFLYTKWLLRGKTRKQLLELPPLGNPNMEAVCSLINQISHAVYLNLPNLRAVMIFKLMEISLKHGIDHNSASAFVLWGFINCAMLQDYDSGYRYGRLCLEIIPRFEERGRTAMTMFIYGTFIQHYKEHIRQSLPLMLESHLLADREGDLTYFSWTGAMYCILSFLAGKNLGELTEAFSLHGEEIKHKKQDLQYHQNLIFHQTTLNLQGASENPLELVGTIYHEGEMISRHIENREDNALSCYYFCTLTLNLLFGSWEGAYQTLSELDKYRDGVPGAYRSVVTPFYESLACLKFYPHADFRTRRMTLRRVRRNQRRYKKVALSCPANHAHKYTLVEAERARVKRKYKKAPALYDQAIAGAIEQEFTQDAALASEFAADFYREIGDEGKTMAYARDALGHYEKWGAFAKVEHVKEKFRIE